MYARMYIRTYVCDKYEHVCVCVYACVHMHMFIHRSVLCTCVCVCVRAYVNGFLAPCVYMDGWMDACVLFVICTCYCDHLN